MNKKIVRALLLAVVVNSTLITSGMNTCFAQEVSSNVVKDTIKVNGCTLVAIDDICKLTGASYDWDSQTKKITVKKDSGTFILQIDNYTIKTSDGEISSYLDVAPTIHNGQVMVPLRAIAEMLGSTIEIDPKSKAISIVASDMILVPKLTNTSQNHVENWATVSCVQQFLYKDNGIGYAYTYGDQLIINTPNNHLSISSKYPILGDVNTDDEGNFYIVWGKEGKSNTEETVFITKYSPEGKFIGETGFVGESVMKAEGNTQIPFEAGKCTSAIGNGRLMVNYARQMYSGHQSNNVIGVNLSDMSPVSFGSLWDIPYTSHSFNQAIIWSEKNNQFIYADQGDAYDRGFTITSDKVKELVFHFYLQANANYDMYIVNETFAQLGNLAETNKGIALVGASAKSIGEAAKSEKQNLFIQMFDLEKKDTKTWYLGGEERKGQTSMDINDNKNAPLTSVTDYGVQWLTNYTDVNVIAPQVVTADDQLVILWTTENDSFYMVLSEDGKIVKPATSLNGLPLNSYECPVYFEHAIYWVGVKEGKLKTYSIRL